ncbi:MAG: hypothetical protein U9N34_09110, partial [Candidatus Cloacimonadota bacterium]|nr:hypothetical protein [Candidatus Cloacimonadota bacterium]
MKNLKFIKKGLYQLETEQLLGLIHPDMLMLKFAPKEEIIEYLMEKFKDKESWKNHLKSLGGDHYEIIKALTLKKYLRIENRINNSFKNAIKIKISSVSGNESRIIVSNMYQYVLKKRLFQVFLSNNLRKGFAEYVKEEPIVILSHEKADGTFSYNNEPNILNFLEIIIIILNDDKLDRKINGELKQAALKKIYKILTWEKVIIDDKQADFQLFKGFITFFDSFNLTGISPKEFLILLFSTMVNISKSEYFLFDIL